MDPTLKTVLLTMLTGLMMASVGYAFARIGRSRDRKTDETLRKEALAIEAVKERDERIDKLQRDLDSLAYKSGEQTRKLDEQAKAAIPITAAMQAMLIAKLTNAHTPEVDALLKKVTDNTLTVDDATEFAKGMAHRETDMEVSEAQRLAADILPKLMRLRELDDENPQQEVKTIVVTVPETETVAARDGGTQEQEKGN